MIATPKNADDFKKKYNKHFTKDIEFRFDAGWNKLVDTTLTVLSNYLANKPLLAQRVKVHCIKEKFGSLRLYLTNQDEFIAGVLAHANVMSEHTCEICGAVGKIRKYNCVKVVCDKCYPEFAKGLKP